MGLPQAIEQYKKTLAFIKRTSSETRHTQQEKIEHIANHGAFAYPHQIQEEIKKERKQPYQKLFSYL